MQAIKRRFPRAWEFAKGRLSTKGYLGIHFTLGMILSAIALGVFAFVAYDVFRRDQLVAIDRSVIAALRGDVTNRMLPFFKTVTVMGNGPTLAAIGLTLLAILALRRRKVLLVGWTAALIGGWFLETGLKLAFRRPRPSEALVELPTSFSFPSGHALVSLVCYGMLAYVVWLAVRSQRARAAVIAATALLVVTIGFSRIYLGVHYFSDVMAGFAAGMTWLTACVSGLEVARRRRVLRDTEAIAA